MRKRALSLLEVVIVIAVIAIAGGALGWKLHQMVARKRFTSSVERLHSRLHVCRRLALNMQADWRGTLDKKEGRWAFETFSTDSDSTLPILWLDSFVVFLNGEEKEDLAFDFTATGEVYPKGVLVFASSKDHKESITWTLPDLFHLKEGKELGPLSPNELKTR